MNEIGSKILVYIAASLTVNLISYGLKSSFLPNFIDGNLITILLALMAINSTTNSVILTKLKDLTKDNPIQLQNSKREMKVSIIEQLVLTVIAIVGLILKKSDVLKQMVPHRDFFSDLILVAVLCYSIHVLYDTANSVFVILDKENKNGGASS